MPRRRADELDGDPTDATDGQTVAGDSEGDYGGGDGDRITGDGAPPLTGRKMKQQPHLGERAGMIARHRETGSYGPDDHGRHRTSCSRTWH